MSKFKEKVGAFFGKEGRSSSGIFILAISMLLAVNVLLYVLVTAFGWYFPEKKEDDLSLSGSTDMLFADAIAEGKKVKISFCMPDPDSFEGHDTGKYVHLTALEFQKDYPDFIELEYINVMTRRDSHGRLVDLEKYKKDMRGEEQYVLKTSVIFECGENYKVLTDAYSSAGFSDFYTLDSSNYITSYNGEEVMAAMISWVLQDEHKTAYFTQYHGEAPDIAFANLLSCAGYYIDVIDLRQESVPEDAAMLVVSNPKTDFERAAEGSGIKTEIERMRDYLDRGGNLFVTLDPYVKTLAVFESFLDEYGISFAETVTESGIAQRNLIKDPTNAITTDGFTLVTEYSSDALAEAIKAKTESFSDGRVIVRECSALELSGNAKPILVSSGSSVCDAGGVTVDEAGSYAVAAYSEAVSDAGVARVFVIPSIYLTASDALVSRGYSNKDFAYALLEEFFGSDMPPYGCRPLVFNTNTLENLTMGTAKLYTALLMLIPVSVAAVGAVILIRRKYR